MKCCFLPTKEQQELSTLREDLWLTSCALLQPASTSEGGGDTSFTGEKVWEENWCSYLQW